MLLEHVEPLIRMAVQVEAIARKLTPEQVQELADIPAVFKAVQKGRQ